MNSALLISPHNHTCDTIRAVLPTECNIDQVNNPTKAVHLLHDNIYDIVFTHIQNLLEHWNPEDSTSHKPEL